MGSPACLTASVRLRRKSSSAWMAIGLRMFGAHAWSAYALLQFDAVPWPAGLPSALTSRQQRVNVALPTCQVAGGGHSRCPTISRNNKEERNEDARYSTCNGSAGGRRDDRKCPVVGKPHSACGTEGRRPRSKQLGGRENYRPGRERCGGNASPSGVVGKPHSAGRSNGRRHEAAALIPLRIGESRTRAPRRPRCVFGAVTKREVLGAGEQAISQIEAICTGAIPSEV